MQLQRACYAVIDGFTDSGSDSKRKEALIEVVASATSFFIAVLLISLFGKWLWNTVIVDLFTVVRPIKDVWQVLGLMIFLSLIR